MKLKRVSIAGVAVVVGAGILFGPRMFAWAQTLAGTMAAGAAGATLGAAAGSGMLSPSEYAKKATDASKNRQAAEGAMMPDAEGGASPDMPNVSMQEKPDTATVQPEKWGNENGRQMLQQLTGTPHRRYSAGNVGNSRRHRGNVLAKYQKPPKGWLAYYLPEDRYKVTSKIWQVTTTPNDKYYYEPWVLATKHRPASQVIGFHTWQDAMIAGYRPDPKSLPAPGRQLAMMASYSKGPMMEKYIEFVYAGQIAPVVFDENYNYVMKVAHQVESSSHWSHLLVPTVEQAIGSTIGLTSAPRAVGSVPQTQTENAEGGMPGEPGMPGDPDMPSPEMAPDAPPAP